MVVVVALASGCSWSGVVGVVADSEAESTDASTINLAPGGPFQETLSTSGTVPEGTTAASSSTSSASAQASGGASTEVETTGDPVDSGVDPSAPADMGDSTWSVKGGEPDLCPYEKKEPCDDASADFGAALGLGCERGVLPELVELTGAPESRIVHVGDLGGPGGSFSPREGERVVILSTGKSAHLAMSRDEVELDSGCPADSELCPSTEFGPMYRYEILPPPIDASPVDGEASCLDEPGLVGTGDCSRTILEQWQQGGDLLAYDYTEMRFTAIVPDDATHLRFAYVFFSSEYPARLDAEYNDLFIAWVESERWTGNLATDGSHNPVAVDAVRFDYLDAEHPEHCPAPCSDPELHGFGMEGHAATNWIERRASVISGDEISVVFALFDTGDAAGDSVIMLDDVNWECALPG